MGKAKKKQNGKSKSTENAREKALQELEQAAAEMDLEGEEAPLDFESLLREVKRELKEYEIKQSDWLADDSQPKVQERAGTSKSKSMEDAHQKAQEHAGYPGSSSSTCNASKAKGDKQSLQEPERQELRRKLRERIQNRSASSVSKGQVGWDESVLQPFSLDISLNKVASSLYDMGVLSRPEHVRKFIGNLLHMAFRAGYSKSDLANILMPLFVAHGSNLFMYRDALATSPVFDEKMKKFVKRHLGQEGAEWRPWPVRHFAEVCLPATQYRKVDADLQADAEPILWKQRCGEVSALRAHVDWEIAKFNRRKTSVGMGRLTDLVCGAVVCESMAVILKCLKGLQEFTFAKDGLEIVTFRDGFEEADNNEFENVPYLKLILRVGGAKGTPKDGHLCELQVHHRKIYEVMQVTGTGSLGNRLKRDLLYDPKLMQAMSWEAPKLIDDKTTQLRCEQLLTADLLKLPPAKPEIPVTLEPFGPISKRSAAQAVLGWVASNLQSRQTLLEVSPERAILADANSGSNPAAVCAKVVATRLEQAKQLSELFALGHPDNAIARCTRWENSLIEIADDSEVHKHDLRWQNMLITQLKGDFQEALEAQRLFQLMMLRESGCRELCGQLVVAGLNDPLLMEPILPRTVEELYP
eukprot:gnl/MRDRNA2_/MRDRNA2_30533_c0_seq1.p1 gnl/MRDRNA2_/MRDRNA2_30533_c0~~gnl/MRDRNA2_/MRDRNA2_30533_c0_seq1.p1  ORF type:complete len:640 (-),score=143.48 gnl/MRDRNA2_/MRDRNA2_30533_c0_seq1:287-2206(-)